MRRAQSNVSHFYTEGIRSEIWYKGTNNFRKHQINSGEFCGFISIAYCVIRAKSVMRGTAAARQRGIRIFHFYFEYAVA